MNIPSVKFSEEVARFAFEVLVDEYLEESDVYVAFANPTAGPWKTMKVRGETGASIEIHRFGIFEQRPDLVLLSPSLRQMLVIEAKDTVKKLAKEEQIKKARNAYSDFIATMSRIDPNQLGGTFHFIPGFLYATEDASNDFQTLRSALQEWWPESLSQCVIVGVANLDELASFHLKRFGADVEFCDELAKSERVVFDSN